MFQVVPQWARSAPPGLSEAVDVSGVIRVGIGTDESCAEVLASLLSSEADSKREMLYDAAARRTREDFPSIELYAPLYLSNACTNKCTYCGFRYDNPIERTMLDDLAIAAEAAALAETGIRSVLLVTGESPKTFGVADVLSAIETVRPFFERVAIEVFPMEVSDYRSARSAGASGVSIYQETYDEARYRQVHLAGRKRNYLWRLTAPERAARAGFEEIGLGALLGLSDWRRDASWLATHAEAVMEAHPNVNICFSFPRLRDASGALTEGQQNVGDEELLHMMSALRLVLPQVGAALSTRESEGFRNRVGPRLATKMSAGSSTRPGGYSSSTPSLEQFDIADERSPQELSAMLQASGVPVS